MPAILSLAKIGANDLPGHWYAIGTIQILLEACCYFLL
jgi:hypothetical protein